MKNNDMKKYAVAILFEHEGINKIYTTAAISPERAMLQCGQQVARECKLREEYIHWVWSLTNESVSEIQKQFLHRGLLFSEAVEIC